MGGMTGAGTGTGGDAATGCTADGHGVTDAQGNVLMQCPPDQACLNGACVASCVAESGSVGSIGCDFLAADPPFYDNGTPGSTYAGACYAVFVSNTWTANAHLTVSRAGQTFDVSQFGYIPSGTAPNITYTPLDASGLPPDQVAILFLSHNPGAHHSLGFPLTCPKTPALTMDAAVSGAGKGAAFRVTSDQPIVAYDILPYGGATSFLPAASLLFPTNAWGSNYYVYGPHPAGGGKLFLTIIGGTDGTQVTLNPTQTLAAGGGLGAATANTNNTFTVDAGQTLQWAGAADPSGAVLQSSSPVGVVTGTTYLSVITANMTTGGGQDAAHQQIPHINALGSEYVGPGVVTRVSTLAPESVLYRMVGVVDGTTLTYDPAPPTGAPPTLSAGQIVEFQSASVFTVTSQGSDNPFGFTQYMAGADPTTRPGCAPSPPFAGLSCGLGDEEWVNLLAPAQFLRHYSFFTDPTYATTNLVVTRIADSTGTFQDVTIDCLGGPITGWQPVGNSGRYQVAYVDLVRGTAPVVAACGSSHHIADSAAPFGVVVWGTDYYASYGYAAGGNLSAVNTVVVHPGG
jgi:hypothetical protein